MSAVMQAQRVGMAPVSAPTRWRLPLLAAVVVVGVLITLWQFPPRIDFDLDSRLAVQQVRLDGAFRYLAPQAVEAAVATSLRGSFYTTDLADIAAAVEALPWVASASVRREWPNGLYLDVVEHQPLARWGSDGVLSAEGVVFRPAKAQIPANLVLLQGPDSHARQVKERYEALSGRFVALGWEIESLSLSERRSWQLKLNNGLRVELGRDPVLPRVDRWLRLWPALQREASAEAPIKIDLRYANGIAVSTGGAQESSTQGVTHQAKRGRGVR